MYQHIRQQYKSIHRRHLYKQEVEKYLHELHGLLLIRECVLRSPNCRGKNTIEPTKEYRPNNDHYTL